MTDDFFRARLEQMIDLKHPLAVLASRLPWAQIESTLAPAFVRKTRDGKVIANSDLFGSTLEIADGGLSNAGRPRMSIRLMALLLYLKHAYNLSDEEVVERWAENVVWQYFSGQTYYEPKLPCDATQVGRFRTAIGEAGAEELLKATIDTAVSTKAVRPAEFERIIVDSTVQEKAIAHPVDSRLLEIARGKVVQAAKFAGIALKQTFVKEGRELRRKAGGYAHAKQFRRLRVAELLGWEPYARGSRQRSIKAGVNPPFEKISSPQCQGTTRARSPVTRPPNIILTTLNAKYIHPSLGLSYLLANMGDLKPQTAIRKFTIARKPQEVVDALLGTLNGQAPVSERNAAGPQIIGFGVYIWNVCQTISVIHLLKTARPDILVILGAPEVGYETDEQEIIQLADHVITGWADLITLDGVSKAYESRHHRVKASYPHQPAPLNPPATQSDFQSSL